MRRLRDKSQHSAPAISLVCSHTDLQTSAARAVFEDDVILADNFTAMLHAAIDALPDDWDVLLLGALGAVHPSYYAVNFGHALLAGGCRWPRGARAAFKNKEGLPDDGVAIHVPLRPFGTHAYALSERGARKLLAAAPRANYHVDVVAWGLRRLRLFAVHPLLARQTHEDTTIGGHQDRSFLPDFVIDHCTRTHPQAHTLAHTARPLASKLATKHSRVAHDTTGTRRHRARRVGGCSHVAVCLCVCVCARRHGDRLRVGMECAAHANLDPSAQHSGHDRTLPELDVHGHAPRMAIASEGPTRRGHRLLERRRLRHFPVSRAHSSDIAAESTALAAIAAGEFRGQRCASRRRSRERMMLTRRARALRSGPDVYFTRQTWRRVASHEAWACGSLGACDAVRQDHAA